VGVLNATVITNVRRVAAQYAHHLVPLGCTPEGLAQDLLVHCLERIDRYDPAQASLRTFIDRTIKNKVAAMIEHMLAQKRDPRRCIAPVNGQIAECDDTEGVDALPGRQQDEYKK
jgi:Sigma-70 region 2